MNTLIMGGMVGFLLVVGILIVIALWFLLTYNGLVRLRNAVREAWAQIDVQLKRRHDLIPNLVETVKGYAGHEKATLEEVIRARSAAVAAQGVEQQAQAEANLSGALGRLMVLVEQYPTLKANENFLALQEELSKTENQIGLVRQSFNGQVRQYNTRIQSIPANVVAGMFGFKEEKYFEIEEKAQREAPRVQF